MHGIWPVEGHSQEMIIPAVHSLFLVVAISFHILGRKRSGFANCYL